MKSDVRLVQARPFDSHGLLRQLLGDLHAMQRSLGGCQGRAWEPPTDVYETDKDVVIKVSIPGVSLNQCRVTVNGEVVTVCGVRNGPDPGSVVTYHQMEIRNGYFERHIVVHKPFDPDRATGRYEDGFLYVFIPKAPELVRHLVTIRLDV
jgi:HSP20 family molecular chaperone IbpA